jgi:carbohydrate kinase (thermoresistant glucokinase family)
MKTRFFIIMGVSGCGKTAVGKSLAAKLEWDFYDADDFHPPENIAKMASGIPLNDEDRVPWLASLHWMIILA